MLRERGLTLATMESCSGGLLASTITDVPGSSDYYKGGLVSYATEMKIAWGVDRQVIAEHGVISAECAQAMARAVRERLGADVGIGVTGVAGPDRQEDKPVGTVHIAVALGERPPRTTSYVMPQGREAVKRRAVTTALALLRRCWRSGRRRAVARVLLPCAALLLGAVAAFALLACGGENQPRLLFSSYSSQDRPGLYSVRADGSDLTQVAALEVEGLASPRVPSPDGTRLAFPCRPDGEQSLPQTDLCLSAPDGSNAQVVTRGKLPQSSVVSSWHCVVAGFTAAGLLSTSRLGRSSAPGGLRPRCRRGQAPGSWHAGRPERRASVVARRQPPGRPGRRHQPLRLLT